MTWFRVDDNLAMHPKAIAAGNAALGLWVRAGSWCGQQLTDGFVPKAVAASLGTSAQAKALVDAGLWTKVDGGWQFHDWTERQPTRVHVETERDKARERMANLRRGSGDVRPNTPPNDDRTSDDVRLPRPVPSRPSPEDLSVVVSPPVPPPDDDRTFVIDVARARGHRLNGRPMPWKWLQTTANSLDTARILDLRAEGLSPEAIDVELDRPRTPPPAATPPLPAGPALPGPWTPTVIADALEHDEHADAVRALRSALA